MDFRGLYHLAAGQQGVFTRDQALRAGASAYQVRSRVLRGEWVVVVGDVLAIAGLPLTGRVREAAALLAVPGTVLGGPTAAKRFGLLTGTERIFVAGAVYTRSPQGVVILRGRVPAEDMVWHGGWAMTTPARTVVDCMRVLPDDPARAVAERALDRGLVTAERLAYKVGQRRGRRGTPRLNRLLAEIRSSGCRATSDASTSRTGSTAR